MNKRTYTQTGMLVALACLAAVSACGGTSGGGGGSTPPPAPAQPVTETEATDSANELIGLFADDGASKAQFIAESKTFDEMGGEASCAPQVAPEPGGDPPPPSKCEKSEFDADEVAKDVKEWFKDNLFNAELKDEKLSTDKMIVYCLKAEDLCEDGGDVSEPPQPIKPGDDSGSGSGSGGGSDGKSDDADGNADCIKGLKEVPVCVAVIKHGDKNLSGKVMVGYDPQVIPMTFTMTENKFTFDGDLAKFMEAAKMVSKAMGEDLPKEFPQVAEGLLGAQLVRGADKKITGTFSIKKAVHVGAFDKTHKEFYDVKIAQATTALKVVLGHADRTLVVGAGLNTIDVGVAADLLFGKSNVTCSSGGGSTGKPPVPGDGGDGGGGGGDGDPPPPDDGGGCGEPKPATPKEGAFFASVGGASFEIALSVEKDKSMDSVSITGLGLGSKTTTVKYDDTKKVHALAAFDLNKNAKPPHKLDLSLTYDGDQVKFLVVPQLDAVLAHTMAAVAKLFDDDMPKFLHKGSSQVTLGGADKPALEFKFGSGDSISKGGEPIPVPDPGGDGKDDKGGDGKDDDGEGDDEKGGKGDPPGEGGDDDGGDWPWIKVLDGLLTLKAWGLDGMADVKVEVKAGSCVVEAGKDGGKDGGDKESHIFGQLASGTCVEPKSSGGKTTTPVPNP